MLAVANQTEPIDEVIVVDNNSSDLTAAIASSFPFVKLIHEPRRGLRYARNAGLDAATGDLLGRIDADSRLTPDWAARARKLFESASVMAATGPCYYHDMPLINFNLAGDHFCRNLFFKLNGSPLLYGSNMILRRSAWLNVRPSLCRKGEFFEDLDMTIHLREMNYKLIYDKSLVAGVSSRRMDDSPRAFLANMRQHNATFELHGQTSIAARCAKFAFLSVYPLVKVLRNIFNPETRRIDLTGFASKRLAARPNSNT